jgi:Asp-tRNA(Asn)/Glu-tRNA(Gln) amidotransferase C subunit
MKNVMIEDGMVETRTVIQNVKKLINVETEKKIIEKTVKHVLKIIDLVKQYVEIE